MISIIIVALFFIGSAFFSGAEIGLISLDINILRKKSVTDQKSKKILKFVSNKDKVLGTTLLGTNISNIIVSSVFTAYIVKRGILPEAIATLILAGTLLLFGEIIPKIFFRKNSNQIISRLFSPIKFFSFIFSPFIWVFSKISNSFFRLFKIPLENRTSIFSKEDISFLLKEAAKNGEVRKEEHSLIEEVLDFKDLTVKNIMQPRTNIVAVKMNTPIKDVIELSKKEGFTRFPIFSKNIDHIQGLIVIHDLLNTKNLDEPASKFMREAYFVPEVMKATTLLKRLQEKKTPIAIAVDEYGGTAGIISVEDLLEELVGEIEDEYDVEEKEIYKINDDSYIIDGEVEIERLIEDLGLDLEEGDYESLAGYIINHLERIPKYNERFLIGNYLFIIKQVTTKKIEKVLIKLKPKNKKKK